jgi:hypothetical protein
VDGFNRKLPTSVVREVEAEKGFYSTAGKRATLPVRLILCFIFLLFLFRLHTIENEKIQKYKYIF